MTQRKTAGELLLGARRDTGKYDPLDVGHAMCDDVLQEIWKCIDAHKPIINEPEFCVVILLADDCLLKGIVRRKFYAWPYLPKPRPRQSAFLYRRSSDDIEFLWALPAAEGMSVLSSSINVAPEWRRMRGWCQAFYDGKFHEHIRKQAGITMLSESEYLDANREKLIEAGCQDVKTPRSEPFDFSKVLA